MYRLMSLILIGIVLLIAGCGSSDQTTVVEADEDVGKTLYLAHCAACHGPAGEGQPKWKTPDEKGVYPAPPHDSSGHTWHHADGLLLEVIARGGSMPTTAMPGFAEQLSQAEMEAILAHIKTFWGEREKEFQQQVTDQWNDLNR